MRHGLHTTTAFGLRGFRRTAAAHRRGDVVAAIEAAARQFFLADTGWASGPIWCKPPPTPRPA